MRLGDPMPLNWLASTGGSRFAGDYFGTAVSNGAFVPMFIAATAPDADGTLHEFMAAAGPIVP